MYILKVNNKYIHVIDRDGLCLTSNKALAICGPLEAMNFLALYLEECYEELYFDVVKK